MNGLVTVVIPSTRRPERLRESIASLLRTAPEVEVIAVIPHDDYESIAVAESFVVVKIIDQEPRDFAIGSWNKGAAVATGDLLVNGADDLIFHDGWLEEAMKPMDFMKYYGMVGFNDLSKHEDKINTHYMVSRAYAVNEWGGVLCCPHYAHDFMDVEAIMRAKRDDRYIWAEKSIVEHFHPYWDKAESDAVYELGRQLSGGAEAVYRDREKRGFPNDYHPSFDMKVKKSDGWGSVAIGARSSGKPDIGFFESWTQLMIRGLRKGDSVMEVATGLPSHLAANALVRRFLSTGNNSLLFIDDDMVFDGRALEGLRTNESTWDYDIVSGFFTHRRLPPHAVIMREMNPQPSVPVSHLGKFYDTLAGVEDGSVIDVDAVGLAFTLIKRHVFEAMLSEYGALYTSWFDWGGIAEGEDITFSQKAQSLGFRLAVDTNVKIGHVGRYVFTWDDHQRWLVQQEQQNG